MMLASAGSQHPYVEQGFVWRVIQDAWERGYDALDKFKRREGHCRVPISHFEEDYNLEQWESAAGTKGEDAARA